MSATYVVPDMTGTGRHCRVTFTDEQQQRFGDWLEEFFTAGMARYGSVEAFTNALRWYNALSEAI